MECFQFIKINFPIFWIWTRLWSKIFYVFYGRSQSRTTKTTTTKKPRILLQHHIAFKSMDCRKVEARFRFRFFFFWNIFRHFHERLVCNPFLIKFKWVVESRWKKSRREKTSDKLKFIKWKMKIADDVLPNSNTHQFTKNFNL